MLPILVTCSKNSTSQDAVAARCRDISEAMKDRVAKGYGFNPAQNVMVLDDDVILRSVWEWLASILIPPTDHMTI